MKSICRRFPRQPTQTWHLLCIYLLTFVLSRRHTCPHATLLCHESVIGCIETLASVAEMGNTSTSTCSEAWLDNGSDALRSIHIFFLTSNETRFRLEDTETLQEVPQLLPGNCGIGLFLTDRPSLTGSAMNRLAPRHHTTGNKTHSASGAVRKYMEPPRGGW
jgi:hypothetical protein